MDTIHAKMVSVSRRDVLSYGGSWYNLSLLYILIFSASLFAFVQVFSAVDLDAVAAQIPAGLPRRGLGIFMLVASGVTLVVWGAPMVTALLKGGPPDRMDSYTSMVTYRDRRREMSAGRQLDAAASRHIFDRDGQITQVWVTIAD